MLSRKRITLAAASAMMLACVAPWNTNAAQPQPTNSGGANQVEPMVDPQMWMYGVDQSNIDAVKQLKATGARYIIDLYTVDKNTITQYLLKHTRNDLGLCLTLRWVDKNSNGKYDSPPPKEEAARKARLVLSALNSPEAKKLGDRLWIQFFNEVGGGYGTIKPKDVEQMLAFATSMTQNLRRSLPQVKVCGPALTDLNVLKTARNKMSASEQERYQTMRSALQWSVSNADAVDVHLHAKGADWARAELDAARMVINARLDSRDLDVVCWEWNVSRSKVREDSNAVAEEMKAVWDVMAKAGVKAAAYARYQPSSEDRSIAWVSLVDQNQSPREPYYGVIAELSKRAMGPRRLNAPVRIGDR